MNDLSNLKKAISLIAFGFFFMLININLTISGRTINITPDFIGWLLYFLSIDRLGDYAKGKEYLKWAALGIMLLSIVQFAFQLLRPEQTLNILDQIMNVCEMVYVFLLLGIVEMVAEDIGSSQVQKIHTVRIVNVAAYVFLILFTMFMGRIDIPQAVTILVMAVVLLIVAIMTLFALLKLRKEINAL